MLEGNKTQVKELELTVTFDPLREWEQIEAEIGVDHIQASISFDERINRRNKLIDQLVKTLTPLRLSYSEIFDRLIAVPRSRWALNTTQQLNQEIFPGFEAEEMISQGVLAEIIASGSFFHDELNYLRNVGKVDKRWVAIDGADALGVSTGIIALAAKEGIMLGRNAVDLGGGDGSWGIVLARLGFNTVMIERDSTLTTTAAARIKSLKEKNISLAETNIINDEFHLAEDENSPAVNDSLKNADVMVCYPWPNEVSERLELFKKYAKDHAVLVMYGSGVDDFYLDLKKVEELGLEVVGFDKEDLARQRAEKSSNRFNGLPAPSFGSNWVMIRKSNINK
ncbi:MAG: hypothetical protein ACOZAK_03190 [Patescibacteria group bacterium]